MTDPLTGKCVLILEDEPIVAMGLATEIIARGAEIVCPVGVEAALKAVKDTALDGAIIDISLTDRADFPVIRAVVDKQVPLVLTTAYEVADGMPAGLVNVRHFEKPVAADVVCRALERAISEGAVPSRRAQAAAVNRAPG